MFKVVSIDNMDQVMRKLTKIGKGNGQELTTEIRKELRKVVNSYKPMFQAATPEKTGDLKRSIKVKSGTAKGVTKIRLVWDADVAPYGGYVNFWKKSPHYRKISNLYKAYKWRMDQTSQGAIRLSFKTVFERAGFTVK
jgi:hypothetical protein